MTLTVKTKDSNKNLENPKLTIFIPSEKNTEDLKKNNQWTEGQTDGRMDEDVPLLYGRMDWIEFLMDGQTDIRTKSGSCKQAKSRAAEGVD